MKYLWLILLFALATPASALDPCDKMQEYVPIAKRYYKGLVFSAKKCGIKPNYILGTMHTDNPEVIDKIDYAFDLLAKSKIAFFETKLEGDDLVDQLKASYFPSDSIDTLRDKVGSEYYVLYKQFIARDFPDLNNEMIYYRMRPWAAALLLQYPAKVDNGKIMDEQFQEFAKKQNIEISGVESGKEMLEFFVGMKEQTQVTFFKYCIDFYEDQRKETLKLTEAYMEENLDTLNVLATESIREMKKDPELNGFENFEKALITDRNIKMVQRPLKSFKQGNSFMAVGALHLPGEKGVLRLLEKEGFYIDVVERPKDFMYE